jgi:hypothetical protein
VIIQKNYDKESFYVANFILFPAFSLAFRCWNYHYVDFFKVLEIGSAGFILVIGFIFVLYGFIEKSNPERIGIYFFVIPVVALYSYAAVYIINCEFDSSKPSTFNVKIIDKYYTSGKNSGYYLTVDGWEKHTGHNDVRVSHEEYDNLKIGEPLEVDFRDGLLTIPWYQYIIN